MLEFLVMIYNLILLFMFLPETNTNWKITAAKCIKIVITAWGIHMILSALITIFKITDKVVECWKNRTEKAKIVPKVETFPDTKMEKKEKFPNTFISQKLK